MKRIMAVFAALLLLLCAGARAESTTHQFSETWMAASALAPSAAYVLDRDGGLYRWDYSDRSPEFLCTLPVATADMFMNYEKTYPDLPEENRARIDETVNLLAADGATLYAINKYAGRIGTVDAEGVHWQTALDAQCFLNDAGETRMVNGSALLENQLYLALDYWEEAPDAEYNSRILRINLRSGETRLYEATEAYRICGEGDGLLLLCANDSGAYLARFDPASGQTERLKLAAVAGASLTCDTAHDAIYISTDEGVYCSRGGADFTLAGAMPAQYAGSRSVITTDGRYVFTGDGIWTVSLSGEETNGNTLSVLLHSDDPKLRSLFMQAYPDATLDWRTNLEMTAADAAEAIRAGDTETTVFSVEVDGNFESLISKGFAAPLKNAAIIDSVSRMYPSLAAPLKNAAGEIVAYPWNFDMMSAWGVNRTLWNRYFPDRALPVTWSEFFTLMREFEGMDDAEGDLFLTYWNYSFMLERVLTAYIQRANARGEAVDFSGAALADTLRELNKARAMLQSRGVESYDEAEIYWDSETVGDHSIFYYGAGTSTHSSYLWNEQALTPFTFSPEEEPVYAGSMRVLIVNPNAEQRELAEAFVALLAEPAYGVMRNYVFHADATAPYSEKPYTVTGEMIAQWQKATGALEIAIDDPLQSQAFMTQMNGLIQRYAAGQMDDGIFLSALAKTAELVRKEAK